MVSVNVTGEFAGLGLNYPSLKLRTWCTRWCRVWANKCLMTWSFLRVWDTGEEVIIYLYINSKLNEKLKRSSNFWFRFCNTEVLLFYRNMYLCGMKLFLLSVRQLPRYEFNHFGASILNCHLCDVFTGI